MLEKGGRKQLSSDTDAKTCFFHVLPLPQPPRHNNNDDDDDDDDEDENDEDEDDNTPPPPPTTTTTSNNNNDNNNNNNNTLRTAAGRESLHDGLLALGGPPLLQVHDLRHAGVVEPGHRAKIFSMNKITVQFNLRAVS